MNQQDIIMKLYNDTKLTQQQCKDVVRLTLGYIKAEVKKGKSVKLVGFGTFKKVKHKARVGRNPQTGEVIKISAKNHVKFITGREFKKSVN